MGFVGLLAGRVDDEEQMIAAVGDHEIVEDAARRVGEEGVALSAHTYPDDVHRDERFERPRRVGRPLRTRLEADLAHVRDIEEPRMLPRVLMLLQDAGRILHRHLVAREGHHARPELHMERVKGRSLQLGSLAHGRHLPPSGRESARQAPAHPFRRTLAAPRIMRPLCPFA